MNRMTKNLIVTIIALFCVGCNRGKTNITEVKPKDAPQKATAVRDGVSETTNYFEAIDRRAWSGFGGLSADLVKKDWVIEERRKNTRKDVDELVYVAKNIRRGQVEKGENGRWYVSLLSKNGRYAQIVIEDTSVVEIETGRGATGYNFKRYEIPDSTFISYGN